jgi:hypothetical protein
MIRHRSLTATLGAAVLVIGGLTSAGCTGGDGQPARGTIASARKGGGRPNLTGEKVKVKGKSAATAGRARDKRGGF